MKYEDIKTPTELLEYMNDNIKYGYVELNNKKIHLPTDSNFNDSIFIDERWKLSSGSELCNSKYGICFDQVELEKEWFSKNNYEYKTIYIMFLMEHKNDFPTHTYLIYKDKEDNKYCYFEHADFKNKGIYKFNNLNEAIKFQKEKFIENANNYLEITKDDINTIRIYQYNSKEETTAQEFINNVVNYKNEIII